MEYLPNGFTLFTPHTAFPLSTDSMLLANFVKLRKNATVLDLGAGCATLGVLLCATDASCTVTGVEISRDAHEAALENIRQNKLTGRLNSICGDIKQFSQGNFHCCVSNPPYFAGGPASQAYPLARREDHCTPTDLFAAAARNLRYGGDFFLVHKPERLAELIACGAKEKLEAKQLRLVRHTEGGQISLILLAFRKGGKPGLIIDEVTLFHKNNSPTDFYKSVYHI